jgi:BirA family biotin operon repressor/biotin-[acetyl-CoA-carboxylase] ligase
MLSIRSLFKKKKDDGIRYLSLQETASTNSYCLQTLSAQPADPAARLSVVTAEYQSAGKGQGTNTWESESGQNLLFSVLCHPVWVPVAAQFILSEAIALALRDVLGELTSDISIKWPNDIYWRDRKICGILIENRLGGGHIKDCVIGVGLNVNQRVFTSDAPNPVSLYQILGVETDRAALLKRIVERFDYYYRSVENGDYGLVAGSYMASLYRASGFYTYRDGDGTFEAALVEVEDDGHLILRDREGRIRSYAFKEVEFIIE